LLWLCDGTAAHIQFGVLLGRKRAYQNPWDIYNIDNQALCNE
jgi:hypothetical protein